MSVTDGAGFNGLAMERYDKPMSDWMPTHPAGLSEDELVRACRVERTRGSGPGGQRRNKVETAVRLTHEPTGVSVMAGERRAQAENRRIAIKRLRLKLALQVRGGDLQASPSVLWRSRVVKGRIAVNPKHEDFPALLAEALDVIGLKRGDVAGAGAVLGVSSSQLVKLLKLEPEALARVNRWREERGMRGLK